MSTAEDESQLIEDAIAGDRTSLAQLLLIHYDALRRRVESRLSRELQSLMRAEDILQQCFVRAANSIGSFENRHAGAFRGWLWTIADNLVRDAEKRRRRERRAGHGDQQNVGQAPDGDMPAPCSSPSRQAARGENVRSMKAAMALLPDDQREVLQRRYFLGQSLDEIASATGRTRDGVRGLCFRARRNLRRAMGHSSLYFTH